ncbi:MAG: DUF1957 domain-containing protein [Chloroflexi bacterium]|nr:DUF1957 domain-containing protein [Chloroflexota bacterium]
MEKPTTDQPTDLCIIMHAHAPFVRQPGPSSHGEEELHGLMADCYIPLLRGLADLIEQNKAVKMGLAISPILLHQLNDPVVQKHMLHHLDEAIVQAERRLEATKGDEHEAYLAQFYLQLHQRTLHVFEKQWSRNIVAMTRELVEAEALEVLGHTATYPVPHLYDRPTLRTQVEIGTIALMHLLGQTPSVLWSAEDPVSPEWEQILKPLDMRALVGTANPELRGQALSWLSEARQTAVITPDQRLLTHIRSVGLGYPGDPLYRAPMEIPMDDGMLSRDGSAYDPFYAYARARMHARHFTAVLSETASNGQPLVIVADMELFGSGWFEGGLWLRTLLEELPSHFRLVTPSTLLKRHKPSVVVPPQHFAGIIDGRLSAAHRQLQAAVAQYPQAYGDREQVLNQAAREFLLAQSGDWDRWVGTPGADYANARRSEHLQKFDWLMQLLPHETLLPVAAREFAALQERDNPFPTLNYRLFGNFER